MFKHKDIIEADLIRETVANQTEITVFEPKTAIRGLITAVAGTVREMWNDLYQTKRKIFLNTSSGEDLDELGEARGIIRLSAAKASVLIRFAGTSGTVIPAGSIVTNPSSGTSYETKTEITLGRNNSSLFTNSSIADVVWAECLAAGTIGNSQVNTITGKPAIAGLTSVTNPSPAQGGADIESDGLYRERIRNYISTLNQGTEAAYEAWVRGIDPRVLRVKSKRDRNQYDSILLILVSQSGAPFLAGDLNFIASEVMKKHRAYSNVRCININFTAITVKERVKIKSGFTLTQVFASTADACAGFFNWKNWEFGQPISIDDLFVVCDRVAGVEDIELNTFVINATNPVNASVTLTLYTQVSTASDSTSITASAAAYTPDALIGKYVRIISGTGAGQTRQIIDNTATKVTIQGTWTVLPPNGSQFIIVELYIVSSRTQLAISDESLPYFFGLEVTDIANPNVPVTQKTHNIIQQQQNQNQQ